MPLSRSLRMQKRRQLGGPEGPREEEALPERTAQLTEPLALVLTLDAFGHRGHAERFADADDRVREGGFGGRFGHGVNEWFGDLQDVDRAAGEVSERRVTGAEVVDGEENAEALQLPQAIRHRGRVLHEDALCDLECEGVRGQSRLTERASYVAHEPGPFQLNGREIDSHAEGVALGC